MAYLTNIEYELHGVGADEESLAGHEGQVGDGGVGEDGEGGREMPCMAATNHSTNDNFLKKIIFLFLQGLHGRRQPSN